jgi:hypothetical protein
MVRAVLRRLDPAINVVEVFRVEVERLFKHRYSPERLLTAARQAGVEIDRLLRAGGRLPNEIALCLAGQVQRVSDFSGSCRWGCTRQGS